MVEELRYLRFALIDIGQRASQGYKGNKIGQELVIVKAE
jgi:hypothetical protein